MLTLSGHLIQCTGFSYQLIYNFRPDFGFMYARRSRLFSCAHKFAYLLMMLKVEWTFCVLVGSVEDVSESIMFSVIRLLHFVNSIDVRGSAMNTCRLPKIELGQGFLPRRSKGSSERFGNKQKNHLRVKGSWSLNGGVESTLWNLFPLIYARSFRDEGWNWIHSYSAESARENSLLIEVPELFE